MARDESRPRLLRDVFLKQLGESICMFGNEMHFYCMMGNHYSAVSRAMRYIGGVYPQRFNRLECRDGAL